MLPPRRHASSTCVLVHPYDARRHHLEQNVGCTAVGGLGLGDVGAQEFGAPDQVLIRLPVQADEAGTQRAVNAVRAALAGE